MADSGGQGKRPRRRKKGGGEAQLIRALNHDLRRRILRLLNEEEEPLSPVMIGKRLKVRLGNVSYHVGVLRRLGAVTKTGQRPVRGAMEHFYISAVKENEPVRALLEATKESDETSGSRRR